MASEKGHHDAMELLLKHGAKVNVMDGNGQTPLHLAAIAGQAQSCRVLMANGADLTAQTYQGYTAMEVAAEPAQKVLHIHGKGALGCLSFFHIFSFFLMSIACIIFSLMHQHQR